MTFPVGTKLKVVKPTAPYPVGTIVYSVPNTFEAKYSKASDFTAVSTDKNCPGVYGGFYNEAFEAVEGKDAEPTAVQVNLSALGTVFVVQRTMTADEVAAVLKIIN